MSEARYICFSTIGQDSHRFIINDDIIGNEDNNYIIFGGVKIPSKFKIEANSDGDVLLHAITNSISGATGVNVLGFSADKLCLEQGIKDSSVYLKESLKYIPEGTFLTHVSISVECLQPKLKEHIEGVKENLSKLLQIPTTSIGLTATTGEGLTKFGQGAGIQVLVIASFVREEDFSN